MMHTHQFILDSLFDSLHTLDYGTKKSVDILTVNIVIPKRDLINISDVDINIVGNQQNESLTFAARSRPKNIDMIVVVMSSASVPVWDTPHQLSAPDWLARALESVKQANDCYVLVMYVDFGEDSFIRDIKSLFDKYDPKFLSEREKTQKQCDVNISLFCDEKVHMKTYTDTIDFTTQDLCKNFLEYKPFKCDKLRKEFFNDLRYYGNIRSRGTIDRISLPVVSKVVVYKKS